MLPMNLSSLFFCLLLDDVAERNHLAILHLLQGRHVLAVGDTATADDTNANNVVYHGFSPLICKFRFAFSLPELFVDRHNVFIFRGTGIGGGAGIL